MIGPPPRLRIRRRVERPDRHALKPFRERSTSFLVDAMFGSGALAAWIKPLDPAMACSGPALTAGPGARDNLAALAALDHLQPGDVLVIAAHAFAGTATLGDNMARIAKLKGAVGIVTDGMIRDADEILALGMPIFCQGITPDSAFPSGPGTVGFPIDLGGLRIEPGDLIHADRDGVVVVPKADLEAVATRLAEVAAKEEELQGRLRQGEEVSLIPTEFRDEIEYLD